MNSAVYVGSDEPDRFAAAPRGVLAAMTVADLAAVLAIETAAYAVPWTHGNFVDSLAAGHPAFVLHAEGRGAPLGYFVAMDGVGELHLLNLTVAPPHQNQGHGRFLLDALVSLCRTRGARTLWLEVRQSNDRARALYTRHGFAHIALRRGYYPMPAGVVGREDAVVMSLQVAEEEKEGKKRGSHGVE